MSKGKLILFTALTAIVMAVVVEALSSVAVYHYYRANGAITAAPVYAPSATVNAVMIIVDKLKARVDGPAPQPAAVALQCTPAPCWSEHPTLGYRPNPGRNLYVFSRRNAAGQEEILKVWSTVLPDLSRYVGNATEPARGRVLVFGDSYVGGFGVNDEHTFTYLLQQKHRDRKFELHAVPGYSLASAYVQFQALKGSLTRDDIVIVGYAPYLKIRDVAAPSRLRQWIPYLHVVPAALKHLRARLDDAGQITTDLIPLSCHAAPDYCAAPDPSEAEMNKISAALINAIASDTEARVVLFHFDGDKADGVFDLIAPKVERISAVAADFDYVIRDDIVGFDGHPGPFWHYQVYLRLSPLFD